MVLYNNNISILPFYDNLELQNHRKWYAFNQIYNLVTYKNMLLPFQVIIDSSVSGRIVRVFLYNSKDKLIADITSNIVENGLRIEIKEKFSLIKYDAKLPILNIKYEGEYYIMIELSSGYKLYSDLFCSQNNVDDCICIEYKNSTNFILSENYYVDFSDNFMFKMYINSSIGKPEYIFEEEGTQKGGYFFVESQISKKIYKFTFLAPEFICDAIRIIRMCDYKVINTKFGTYNMDTFNIDVSWEDQGDIAVVEVEFETDTIISNNGGYVCEPLPNVDFNNDFNNDFKN